MSLLSHLWLVLLRCLVMCWDQPLSMEKLKDFLPTTVSVPATVPVVPASAPSVESQQHNVEESGDVSWPQDRWKWHLVKT